MSAQPGSEEAKTKPTAPVGPLRWFEYVIALAPLVLFAGGFKGIGLGAAACAVNLTIGKRWRGWPLAAASLVYTVFATLLWALLVVLAR